MWAQLFQSWGFRSRFEGRRRCRPARQAGSSPRVCRPRWDMPNLGLVSGLGKPPVVDRRRSTRPRGRLIFTTVRRASQEPPPCPGRFASAGPVKGVRSQPEVQLPDGAADGGWLRRERLPALPQDAVFLQLAPERARRYDTVLLLPLPRLLQMDLETLKSGSSLGPGTRLWALAQLGNGD